MIAALLIGREKSTGFPGKNVFKVLNKHLMEYPLLAAGGSKYIDEIYVSTDSEKIKEVGRKSSERYVNRFKRRMSLALGVSFQESLWPSNMARYFLNFIWMTEDQSLMEAISVIENQFSLEKVLFSNILEISEDNLVCKNSLG